MFRTALFTTFCLAVATSIASAQDGSAGVDIEGGDTEYNTQTRLSSPRSSSGGGGGTRLGIQGRLPLGALAWDDGDVDGLGFGGLQFDWTNLMVPMVAPGVRIVDGKLWIGLGLGFTGASWENGPAEESRTAWSLSPVVAYDVLGDDSAALSIGGAIHLMSLGETEECDPDCMDQNDDVFGLGLNVGFGVRGKLSEGLALGGEFGWGLLSVDAGGPDYLVHGFLGALKVEASVGL